MVFLFTSTTSLAQTTQELDRQVAPNSAVAIENLEPNTTDENIDNGFIPEPIVEEVKTVTTVRALDKITAHITELELPQGEPVKFGTLQITARTCSTRPPEEIPETFAFLEIDDEQRNNEVVRVFTGWMMASSPALNALEHSVYDIWVISCRIVEGEASLESE